MDDVNRLKQEIETFNKVYPRPGMDEIDIDGEYDLVKDWPSHYPNLDAAGVYVFLDEDNKLLYIGKSSCNNTLGYRIGSYFRYGKNGEAISKYQYFSGVRKILTIPMPKGHEFEASALEEYLIQKLDPALNKVGRKLE